MISEELRGWMSVLSSVDPDRALRLEGWLGAAACSDLVRWLQQHSEWWGSCGGESGVHESLHSAAEEYRGLGPHSCSGTPCHLVSHSFGSHFNEVFGVFVGEDGDLTEEMESEFMASPMCGAMVDSVAGNSHAFGVYQRLFNHALESIQ